MPLNETDLKRNGVTSIALAKPAMEITRLLENDGIKFIKKSIDPSVPDEVWLPFPKYNFRIEICHEVSEKEILILAIDLNPGSSGYACESDTIKEEKLSSFDYTAFVNSVVERFKN